MFVVEFDTWRSPIGTVDEMHACILKLCLSVTTWPQRCFVAFKAASSDVAALLGGGIVSSTNVDGCKVCLTNASYELRPQPVVK